MTAKVAQETEDADYQKGKVVSISVTNKMFGKIVVCKVRGRGNDLLETKITLNMGEFLYYFTNFKDIKEDGIGNV